MPPASYECSILHGTRTGKGEGRRVNKPIYASGYDPAVTTLVRQTCLYVATVLGDLMDEQLVVAGGFVPPMLIPQDDLPEGVARHIGTEDLDLAMSLALLNDEAYHEVADRLRRAGFTPGVNRRGNTTAPRWVFNQDSVQTRVDFLMAPGTERDIGGKIIRLEPDFAAFVTPGLDLAWRDRQRIRLSGLTIAREHASRDVWVCGPAAFIILKALAFKDRGERKDAYDLFYMLRNYGNGPHLIAERIRELREDVHTQKALEIVRSDFTDIDHTGPQRVATFLGLEGDVTIRADVVAFTREFLRQCTM